MPIVTISGPLGAKAREIATMVAEILDIDYLDQTIISDAAKRLGVPADVVAQREERATTRGERFANVLRNFLEHSAAAGSSDPFVGGTGLEVLLGSTYEDLAEAPRRRDGVDETLYASTIATILKELAAKGNIVIAGRGGQIVLQDEPSTLHCLCVAPLHSRALWIVERNNLSLNDATNAAKEHEQVWSGFHRSVFKRDVYDQDLYDIIVNSGRLPLRAAAEAIARAAVEKEQEAKENSALEME